MLIRCIDTAWNRVPASYIAKRIIWRLESDRYALTSPSLYDIGKQLSGYYGAEEPDSMSYTVTERLRGEAWEKFVAMDMFFVKVSSAIHSNCCSAKPNTVLGVRFHVHRPHDTASPRLATYDGILRASRERGARQQMGSAPEVEERPRREPKLWLCAGEQAFRERGAYLGGQTGPFCS